MVLRDPEPASLVHDAGGFRFYRASRGDRRYSVTIGEDAVGKCYIARNRGGVPAGAGTPGIADLKPRPQPIARLRFWSSRSRNWFVVSQGWSGRIRIARSRVISPLSTVSMHTFSSVSAKRTTSGVPSNRPR